MDDKKQFADMFKEKMKNPQWRMGIVVLSTFLIMFVWSMSQNMGGPVRYTVSYSQFMEELNAGNVYSVTIKNMHLRGELRGETSLYLSEGKTAVNVKNFHTYLPSFQGEDLLASLKEKNVLINVDPPEQLSPFWQFIVGLLPWVLIIGIWILIMRGAQRVQGGPGGLFSFGASKAKLHDVQKPSVTFKDVAGMANAKKDLKETIEFLKDSSKFVKLGAKVPKGILLFGPPGTGKTLLARAVAGEAEVPFYSISASEFIEMFVGVGASRVRDMFQKARESQPSIIFIDEIDAVGRTRGTGLGGGNDEREQTLNQLLSELDGFAPHEEVIVIAATNRPDVLDPALLRPGRFDRHIIIDRPGWKDRKSILEVHVSDKKLSDDIDLDELAKGTPGMTGAELENLANEAALIATRENKETIDKNDQLPGTDPIHKVSIIPRGMAMGVTQQLPEEDRHFYPKAYLMNRLAVMLGGRIAEKIVFNDVSTGAQSDLKEASSLAEKMVAQWGMSEKVGPLSLGRGEEHPFLGRELSQPKRYSEDMAWLMDQEIRNLIIEAESNADKILSDKQKTLDALAEALIKDEVLDREDVDRIIRESDDRQ
jgi:cell division protease FtsH